jgi:hypothetical protein
MITRIRGWSPRKRWAVGLGALVLLGGGAALAAFLLRASLTGSGNVVAAPTATVNDVGVLDSQLATCVGGSGNNAQVNNAAAGGAGYCEFALSLSRAGAGGPWVLQDIEFASQTDEVFLNGDCGKVIGDVGTANVRFTTGAAVPAGTIFSAQADAGVVLVEQDEFNPASCPSLP